MEIFKPTVKSLQSSSSKTLSVFRKVVEDLTKDNEKAMKLASVKSNKITKLQDEVHTLATLTEDNSRIANKLLKILE